MRYWLMKSEPSSFSIDDLKARKSTLWDGVRNFQARNFMTNEMKVGDPVLFYHSNADPSCVVGIAEVSSPAEPDPTAFDPDSKYYDPKSTPAKPIWFCVRIKFKKRFRRPVSLEEMRNHRRLQELALLRRGNRLSIQPVGEREFEIICALGGSKAHND